MPEQLSQGKYEPDKLEKQLLIAVQDDRWLPILHPPYDFREIDPRKAAVLANVSNILGRLAVAVHTVYEEVYRDESAPLLKRDKGHGRLQYLTQTTDLNYFHIVFLRGTTLSWRNRHLSCRFAAFVLVPETREKQAQEHFVTEVDSLAIYSPRFGREFISDAKESTALAFNERGEVNNLGNYTHNNRGLFVTSYQVDLDKGNVRVTQFVNDRPQLWDNPFAWQQDAVFSLNQDGVLHSNQGQVEKTPLDEALMTITAKLPLTHYLR